MGTGDAAWWGEATCYLAFMFIVSSQLGSLTLSDHQAPPPSVEDCVSVWFDCYDNPSPPSPHQDGNKSPSTATSSTTSRKAKSVQFSPPGTPASLGITPKPDPHNLTPEIIPNMMMDMMELGGGRARGGMRSTKNQRRTDRSSVVLFVLECNGHSLSHPDFVKVCSMLYHAACHCTYVLLRCS